MRLSWAIERSLPGSTSAVIRAARVKMVLKMVDSSRRDRQAGSETAADR